MKTRFMDELMAEHIVMPGVPQMVVTRDFLYQFLRAAGWCPRERGFGSMEYVVFGRERVADELTGPDARDAFLSRIAHAFERTAP